jgi:anti-anti-sigma regulatory factor
MTATAELQLGDHLCLPFGTDEQLQSHVLEFTAGGLDDRQQVMAFTQAVTVADMVGWLRRQDRAFAAALDTGQLQVHRPEEVHLAGGYFDPERMMTIFAQAADQAEANGYRGLRVTVDMTWALRELPGVEQLFDFEAAANRLFPDRHLIGVCAYDRRRFDAAAMGRASAAHPITPGLSMLRCAPLPDHGLALQGEADIANRDAFAALLTCLPDADATLDLTGLTFADAASLGALVRSAAARSHRTRVCCTPRLARLLRLIEFDQVADIDVVEAT